MANHPGWYPPGQVCYPPELPVYLKHVHDLKPIIGVPKDAEVIGIHSVMHAANRVSGVPGMHDPSLFMRLADHLFSVQMARYRSKYSLITFPSDATYTPPALPTHVSVNLEPVSGVPSDEEIVKVQDAVRAYQHFSSVPSVFDPHVNMELSQHLFNIQMARYMRAAGEIRPNLELQGIAEPGGSIQSEQQRPGTVEETTGTTNNPGKGGNAAGIDQSFQSVIGVDVRELMERSNQLAERFNRLLERSNELAERSTQPSDQANQLTERFNKALDRFTELAEKVYPPTEESNQSVGRSAQIFERFNELLSQLSQPMQQSNQLAERLNQLIEGFNQPLQRSNQLSEKANQLAEEFNQSTQRSNQLAEQAIKPVERLEDLIRNINRVLVGIQHAIVRSYKGNTVHAVDCLVNEKGETPASSKTTFYRSFDSAAKYRKCPQLPVTIGHVPQYLPVPDDWLPEFLRFYGIWEGLCESETSPLLKAGKNDDARERLRDFLSTCLG